jgi:hypothetical protein
MSESKSVVDIKAMFDQYLQDHLNFIEEKGFVILKPKEYLGSENFAKVIAIVKKNGGEYVSAGKESHFRFQKAYDGSKQELAPLEELHRMVLDFKNLADKDLEKIIKKIGELKK